MWEAEFQQQSRQTQTVENIWLSEFSRLYDLTAQGYFMSTLSLTPRMRVGTGTIEEFQGAAYLPAANNITIRGLIGSTSGSDTASLLIKDLAGSTLLTLSNAGALASVDDALNLSSDQWVKFFTKSNNANGSWICDGINLER